MQTQTVTVRDGRFRVHLRTAGSGEPLLFLHGETGLREPDEALDRLAGRFTVYAPDHPGWGASEGLEHLDDILDLALFYYDLLDALGLESAHVVGHSLGGLVAAEMAALDRRYVRKLVLVDALGFWRDDVPVLDFFAAPPDELADALFHDKESPGAQRAQALPSAREELAEALIGRMQALAAAGKFIWPIPDKGLKRRIHRIQAPTLIVWGASDGVVPPVYAEEFRSRIPGSRVVILDRSGHLPMAEQPEEFAAVVTAFLQEE